MTLAVQSDLITDPLVLCIALPLLGAVLTTALPRRALLLGNGVRTGLWSARGLVVAAMALAATG